METLNSPSSTNAYPLSGPSTRPSSTPHQLGKLQVAHTAVLVQDSQRILDLTYQDNKQHREQARRLREAQMNAAVDAVNEKTPTVDEPMGDINIDSPVTENHYHPPQPQPAKKGSKLLAAVLGSAVGIAAGGVAAWMVAKPPVSPMAYDAVYEVQQTDGSWKEVKREHLKTMKGIYP